MLHTSDDPIRSRSSLANVSPHQSQSIAHDRQITCSFGVMADDVIAGLHTAGLVRVVQVAWPEVFAVPNAALLG